MNEFFFSYPVWILSPKGHVEYAELGKGYAAVGETEDNGKYVPVFTEQRYAERYLKDCSDYAATSAIGNISDAETFLAFLKNVRKFGVVLLLVDHIWDASPYVAFSELNIDDVIRDIQDERE